MSSVFVFVTYCAVSVSGRKSTCIADVLLAATDKNGEPNIAIVAAILLLDQILIFSYPIFATNCIGAMVLLAGHQEGKSNRYKICSISSKGRGRPEE